VQTRAFIQGIVNTPLSGKTVIINSAGQLGVIASSGRVKQDITPLARQESAKVHQLRPVTFHYKTEPTGPLQYGLIAEEVAQVYPELVTRDADGVIDGVRYEALTPLLLKEVQGQRHQISTQAQQLTTQAQQLATQDQKLTTQDQQLVELQAQNARLAAALVQQNTALAARLEQLEQGARGMTTVSTR
jgi:hypothetical protein